MGAISYSADLFDSSTAARMARHLRILVEQVIANPEGRLSDIELQAEAERQQLLIEWNDTSSRYDREACVHHLIERQAETTPDAVALAFEDQQLSYGELNRRANQLARYLQRSLPQSAPLIGLNLDRSPELIVGMLGILKCGGAYLPLDPSYPVERLKYMLHDAHISALLTNGELSEAAAQFEQSAPVITLDTDWQAISSESDENPHGRGLPESLAYVIYTSGSTGRPKGVMVSHRSAVNHLLWAGSEFPLSSLDCVPQKYSVSFDTSVLEIFYPLMTGARLVLARPGGHQDIYYLAGLIEEHNVTAIDVVPAMLESLVEEPAIARCKALRRVTCGGDIFNTELRDKVFKRLGTIELANMYGPTEATIGATFYRCGSEDSSYKVPIGRPVYNTQLYVMTDWAELAPTGAPGELNISGDGVAWGYLGRPDLTAEKFIPNPFSQSGGERLYRSGDLVRYLPDGQVEFAGRNDEQVKIRGFRLETGEIESILKGHPTIKQAIVVADRDLHGSTQLVAYIVQEGAQDLPVSSIRSYLRNHLPDYMLPSFWVRLEQFPLTPNGKIDRKALPLPQRQLSEGATSSLALTPTEELVAGIFCDVLGLEHVRAEDNFFELGGHSLLATQVVSRVRHAFSVEMSVRKLFEHPTVAELASHIDALRAQASQQHLMPPITPAPPSGRSHLSFAQSRLWFLDQLEPDSNAYNIPLALSLSGQLSLLALEQGLGQVIRRHEALRTVFVSEGGEPKQLALPYRFSSLPLVDLTNLDQSDRQHVSRSLVAEQAGRSFDLQSGPLLRASIIKQAEPEQVLVLVMHHIVSDGWSTGVLFRELSSLYETSLSGEVSHLPELQIQYGDFSAWQRQWLQGDVLDSQLQYWKQQLHNAPTELTLPTDRPRTVIQRSQGTIEAFELPEALSQSLREMSRRENVTLYMTMLSAFKLLLSAYSGQKDIVVGSPIANRNRIEIESLIGFFINTLVIRTDLSTSATFRQLLTHIRAIGLEAHDHQDMPFEKLVEELHPERDLTRQPLVQVLFLYQNSPMPLPRLEGVEAHQVGTVSRNSKFDLTLSIEEKAGPLRGAVEYNTGLFNPTTIKRMLGSFTRILERASEDPDYSITGQPLLSESETQQILVEWNDSTMKQAGMRTIVELFEEQVSRTPDRVAFFGQMVTYRGAQ